VRVNRVHVAESIAGRQTYDLSGATANHVGRVLRLRSGDPLVLFDGRGGEYAATIKGLGKDRVTVTVGEHVAVDRESPLSITLVQGISRGERMDLVMQKATELGVKHIVPIATERSVVRMNEGQTRRKHEHWRAIAIAACEQCGRNRVPEVRSAIKWSNWLADRVPAAASLLLSTHCATRLTSVLAAAPTVELLIGPEGGLTPEEENAALAAGFRAVNLGPRVLRTESAAIAAIAVIQHRAGDL
jgi:16S rRNA (uracil1498-N3)-methyltransferase